MNRDIRAEDQKSPISKKPTLVLLVVGALLLVAPLGLVLSGAGSPIASWLLYVMLAGGILLGYSMKRFFDTLRVDESEIE